MKRIILTVAAIAALGGGLAACATATPYQPLASGSDVKGGYSEVKVADDYWRVSFAGNSLTSRDTVERYLLYRAAELTANQGYDWFVENKANTDKKTTLSVDPFYNSGFGLSYGWGWRPAWRYRGAAFGWRSYDPWHGGPFWADNYQVDQIDRFDASAEIRMGKGAKPQNALDAKEVMANLGPSIVRPEATK